MQKLKRVPMYCEFFSTHCKQSRCPSWQASRPMTKYEKECHYANDIPVIDPYVYDWCNKYNVVTGDTIKVVTC